MRMCLSLALCASLSLSVASLFYHREYFISRMSESERGEERRDKRKFPPK